MANIREWWSQPLRVKGQRARNFYIRAMFLLGFGYGQVTEPLQVFHALVPFLTWLAVLGFRPTWYVIAGTTIALCIFFIGLAKLLLHMKWMKYRTSLSNEQNPEIKEILEILREWKKKQ